MPTIVQYSDLAYLIETAALGLVSAALITITLAILFRHWSGKREHQKVLSMRKSLQHEKEKIDITINEIVKIERNTHENLANTQIRLNELADQQIVINERAKEIDLRAEHVALLETEVKQTANTISKRIDNIQKHWDEQLKATVETVNQLSTVLNENLEHINNKNVLANYLTNSLSKKYDHLHSDQISPEIHTSINTTVKECTQLTTQLTEYQEQAEQAFSQFNDKLKTYKNQAHKQINESCNDADIAQELTVTENIDTKHNKIDNESIELALDGIDNIQAANNSNADDIIEVEVAHGTLSSNRKDRPKIDSSAAEDLTDPSLIGDYSHANPLNKNKKKYNSFFSPFSKKEA